MKRTYKEQKEILKKVQKQKVRSLYRIEKVRQKKDRYIKREFERVIEALRVLLVVIISPIMIPIMILPIGLLFICMVGMLLYEIFKGMFRLVMYPFFVHMKKLN
jgi:hypothetical protein